MYGNLKGIQHSKAMYVEFTKKEESKVVKTKYFLFGSSNWTLSSQCNREISAIVDMTDRAADANSVREMFESHFQEGQPFSADIAVASMRNRSSDTRIGATQRRFESARARQRAEAVLGPDDD